MKARSNLLPAMLVTVGALLTAGVSTALAADATMAAQAPPDDRHGGPFSKLGLTAEQESSIAAIRTAAKPQMESMHQQMKANHMKLMQTQPDDPNYASLVAEVAQANATLASQRTSQMAEVRAQMYAVLTAAQKTQLKALEAQWAANPHHGEWGARHHGPPPEEE